ncbi:mannitol-1-phosphate 5-dehydrogenase [Pseudoclavibacter sp. RFBJ3]|uniref:mannitol-1-phosphate 5-dehydrogenase n=1 Tax=unclassified Pseudoclavibacter TaxID=2615177 RepID=UPI000CE7FE03|nr:MULTISPECIES: mannitol-1-phosphate 5-dehydrogenase [unclassified Pseudoclavibacter]PPF83954.1 mannitol-1-phosphate 5-dehydrogenase [Pseudoclavibacter sp. RFBJ5]PPF92234.1 mannitol-1-phosphate 5-dehydrogenase [Pseudoclavibacter sp. RFBJ3]PPF97097.1 mannitol-1-phosphate 5-dehydrogenase [Pseudoclavibacter sp. RFBH5]PPG23784.1 mannitol-1-phosphate 5-dehydrogenase [Pseudoclavibacter sp. RFBI4]
MKAVHIGAGNIGRGFIGLVLHEAGYDLVYADVNADLIGALQAVDTYTVHEVGPAAKSHVVDRFRAINSATHEDEVVQEIATADVVTCAVGPNVLRFIAPVIRKGLAARAADAPKLAVMACENAIGASDTLKGLVLEGAEELDARAVFANSAVDRIVPEQAVEGVDVTVEDFFEWTIDRTPFNGAEPSIPDAHFVDDLKPFIERKLFTVNTGHATIAYHGFVAGATNMQDALAISAVASEVEAVLGETSRVLVTQFGFSEEDHAEYVATTLSRFANRDLPDQPARVGRQPLRKLSEKERFVRPASEAEAAGLPYDALVRAIGAALRFDFPADQESVELQQKLATLDAETFTREVTGLEGGALFAAVVAEVAQAQAERVAA